MLIARTLRGQHSAFCGYKKSPMQTLIFVFPANLRCLKAMVVLRLVNIIFLSKGNWRRRLVHTIVAIALRLFFRRIEADGVAKVPVNEPLIFVLNHPNGLIDPALVFVALPRRVSFLAKSTLFKIPVLKFVLRALDVLPLYRQIDQAETRAANPALKLATNIQLNQRTFAACFELLRQNRCIALFPEGVSHNSTFLLPLKTGAARIALGALAIGGDQLKSLKIMPVGLYYTSKTSFRSEALLNFGEPFLVSPVSLDENGQPPRDAVRYLSETIAEKLREVTLNVENKNAFEVVRRTEQLFSSVYESLNLRTTLADELDLRRRLAEKFESDSDQAASLTNRLTIYENRLRELGVSPEHLSVVKHSSWFVFTHFLLRLAVIFALAPLVVVGAILHLPAYLLCLVAAKLFRQHGPDESGGTIKIVAAIALMPLTWLIVAAVVFFLQNWQFALLSLPISIVCGYASLRCLEEAVELQGWFKAVWVLVRRRRLLIELLRERLALHRQITNFVRAKALSQPQSKQ